MDIRVDAAIDRPERAFPLDRLMRIGMVVYLSPVILTVLAIGLVGMLATRIGKLTSKVAVKGVGAAVEGYHPWHEMKRPLGLAKNPAQVRELV
jgi:hypothetical protein